MPPHPLDPRLVAIDAGFRLLPCLPVDDPELTRTTVDRIAWGMTACSVEERRRQWLALARGLDLRAGGARTVLELRRLAEEMAVGSARLAPPSSGAALPMH